MTPFTLACKIKYISTLCRFIQMNLAALTVVTEQHEPFWTDGGHEENTIFKERLRK